MKTISLRQNNKGVSPIIATLLLIVIAVAAAVVTYAFVTGFIGTATSNSLQQGAMSIDYGNITSATNIIVYIRNTGTKLEILSAVYVDNDPIPAATVLFGIPGAIAPYTLAPDGAVVLVNITSASATWDNHALHIVKIVASDGTPFVCSLHTEL
jgi:flagellin-like protein